MKFILNNCKVILWRKQFNEKFFCIIFRNIYVPQCLFSIKRSLAIWKRWSCQKQEKKQPQKHVKQTKFTQSCCKFSVNHSPRVQYVQLKSNSKKNFYLLDIFFILCIYFFWTDNKNQTIKHMHNVLLVLKYHSDGSCQKLDKSIKPIELNQNYLISPSDLHVMYFWNKKMHQSIN